MSEGHFTFNLKVKSAMKSTGFVTNDNVVLSNELALACPSNIHTRKVLHYFNGENGILYYYQYVCMQISGQYLMNIGKPQHTIIKKHTSIYVHRHVCRARESP